MSEPASGPVRDQATARFGRASVGSPPPDPFPDQPPGGQGRRHRLRWLLAGVAVLVLLGAAVYGGRQWGRHGLVTAWQVTDTVAAGTPLHRADLRRVTVSAPAAGAGFPMRRAPAGKVAATDIPAGSLLRRDMTAPGGVVPSSTQALVGVAAAPGLAPGGLRPGAVVTLLRLPPQPVAGQPPPRSRHAKVLLDGVAVQRVDGGTNGGTVLTVLVPDQHVAQVTYLSANGRIAVAATG